MSGKILNENNEEKLYGKIIYSDEEIAPEICSYKNQNVLRILDDNGNYIWAKKFEGYEDSFGYLGGYYLTYSQVANITVDVPPTEYEYNEISYDEATGWYEWETITTVYKVTCKLNIDGSGEVSIEDFDNSGVTSFGQFLVTGDASIIQTTHTEQFSTTDSGFDPPWL